MDKNARDYLENLTPGAVNAAQRPQFEWRDGLPEEPDIWTLLGLRAACGVEQVERALCLLAGELMELEVDRRIFRGALPHGIDGFWLRVEAELPCRSLRFREFRVVCRGRDLDRGRLTGHFALLAGKLPLPAVVRIAGRLIEPAVALAAVRLDGVLKCGVSQEDGRCKFDGIAELAARVLIG